MYKLPGTFTDISHLTSRVAYYKCMSGHIMCHNRTSSHQSKRTDHYARQNYRPCTNRSSITDSSLSYFPIIIPLKSSIRVNCPWHLIVGKDNAWANEYTRFDFYAVIYQCSILNLDVISNLNTEIDINILTNNAIAPNIYVLSNLGLIPNTCTIANAGISIARKSLFETSIEDFRRIEDVNIHGVLFTLREAARHMVERDKAGDGGGSLVAISSTSAIHGAARNAHYAATKGAVVTMARALAVELAPHKISVNSILPGWTRSGLTERLQEWDKFNSNVIGRVPMGGWMDGADFAGIAVYLASPASRYHTGDSIVIDGGYTIY